MGIYLNPGNSPFREILSRTYVDKTGLIDYVNSTVNTPDRMTCFTRPRRFGKSFAAQMLCAYYDRSCDSRALFEGLEISKCESFEKYLNKFDVIYIDMTRVVATVSNIKSIVRDIQSFVIDELREAYPDCLKKDETALPDALAHTTQKTGIKFVFIIDEWDALFRGEAKNDKSLQREYVNLIRGLFKGGVATANTIAAAYITGILPIKKYGTQSAMTDFLEYTAVRPMKLAKYVGFTEDEVAALCEKYDMDLDEMKKWYDGYSFKRAKSVYNPNSVMKAIQNEEYGSYWPSSESYDSLKMYIEMNFDGLKDDIIKMLAGGMVRINTARFQNDMVTINNKNDVLTLLTHLGYFAYDEEKEMIRIPNYEISGAFKDAIEGKDWGYVAEALEQSDDLLEATINGDSDAVAQALERIHETNFSILQYNNEASLSAAITIAYYTVRRYYEIVCELPTGKGFADLAFIPYKDTDMPAMIIELKCDASADSAIKQIKEKRYAGRLKDYAKEILLVGINYDRETKTHTCEIESRV